ncbi:MAG TPA: hypothetical protein VFC78_18715 [Tepidisphaeraceae bacterium]|nr:hypothetical protein [Tepidisphaeraceae bacterium]
MDQKLELSTEGYSPRVLAKRVRQGGKSASFADACDDLSELAEIKISVKHLQRLVARVGGEWAAARDAQVSAFRADRLARDYREPPTGAAAVMLDGGRVQTRERGGPSPALLGTPAPVPARRRPRPTSSEKSRLRKSSRRRQERTCTP